jgi:hypothetical protein
MKRILLKSINVISLIGSIVLTLNFFNLFNLKLEEDYILILIYVSALPGWVFIVNILLKSIKK